MNKPFVVGVDIGGTKIAAGRVDAEARVTAAVTLPTLAREPFDESLGQVYGAIEQCLASGVTAIGICAPGPLNPRTGVVLNPPNLPHWRLTPAKGSSLLKTMIRTRIAGDKEADKTTSEAGLMEAAKTGPIELAGNLLGTAMVEELASTEPAEVAQLRLRALGQDIAGSTLWLRAEPQDDPAMSAAIAADLDKWSASCGG